MKVRFRRKGEVACWDFSGDVVVAGEKVEAIKLPLRDDVLDLSHLPVVTIGGKKGMRQQARLAEFEKQAPDFKGVIFLLPYSWANGWSDGHLYIPSWDALNSKMRISGGRPELQLTNYRWLADGRYVADRARMLHGKAIETLEAEVEQNVPMDELVKKLSDWNAYDFRHPLQQQCLELWRELYDLEKRRAGITDKERDMSVLIREKLVEKFQEIGIRKGTEVPANFAITAEEVAPELVAEAETLGTVEIPGVGRRLTERVRPSFGWGDVLVVELTTEEFRRVTSWPADVYPMVTELGAAFEQLGYEIRDALQVQAHENERLGLLCEQFVKRWADVQKGKNYPHDIEIANPREVNLPAKPEPVIWGSDLLTDEPYTAYSYLGKLRGYGERWAYLWTDSREQAAKADAEARREAESFMTARKLEAELTAEAEAIELPIAMPEPFAPPADPEITEIMKRLGFTPGQFRLEGEGPKRYIIPGDSYFSELRQRSVKIAPDRNVTEWFRRDGDVIVMYSNITVRDLLGDDRYDFGVAEQMGVAKETIQSVRDGLTAERRQSEANYCEKVRKFVEALRAQPTYACLSSDMRTKLEELANSFYVPNPSRIADDLKKEWAKAEVIRHRSERGEILANFGGHFRVMGAAGQCQYWIIQPNGAERDPDEVSYRKRYTSEGEKHWHLVGPEELALSWSKSNTASDHEFVVEKLPAGGCTQEQLATIERLEREISERFDGAVGISGKVSPGIGKGWGLGSKPSFKPNPESTPEPTPKNAEPVNLSKIDPSKLFGGNAKIRR